MTRHPPRLWPRAAFWLSSAIGSAVVAALLALVTVRAVQRADRLDGERSGLVGQVKALTADVDTLRRQVAGLGGVPLAPSAAAAARTRPAGPAAPRRTTTTGATTTSAAPPATSTTSTTARPPCPTVPLLGACTP